MIDRLGSMDALRSTMRKWTPQQLQQFAMQNQDNIIAMSLISQEQRDRDEARQAQAGQQPQQPKVVEQVISELNQKAQQMPEDVGIGRLPAQNLEGMADGGIVGYAAGDVIRDPETGEYYAEPLSAEETPSTSSSWDRFVKWAGRNVERDPLTGEVVRKTRADAPPAPAPSPRYIPTTPFLQEPAQEKPAPKTRPIEDEEQPSFRKTSQAPQATGIQGLTEQLKEAEQAVSKGYVDPNAAKREEIMLNREKQAQREAAGLEERDKGLAALMKSREERIATREGKIGEQEESDKNMAIIRAGLALATSTKKGFLSAVAEGAGVGLDSLAKSRSLTKAERQKVLDARDAMDELRFNQESMSRKEKIAAENKIDEVRNIAKEQEIQAEMKRGDISRQDAITVFNAKQKADQEAAQAARSERIAAQEPADIRATRAFMKDPALAAAYEKMKMAGAGASGERADIAAVSAKIKALNEVLSMTSGASKEEKEQARIELKKQMQRLDVLSGVGATPTMPTARSSTGGWGQMSVK